MIPIAQSLGAQIAQLVAEGLIVTVAVTLCFSIALSGVIRAGEARREGHAAALVAWTVLATLAFAAFAGSVALALHVVTQK